MKIGCLLFHTATNGLVYHLTGSKGVILFAFKYAGAVLAGAIRLVMLPRKGAIRLSDSCFK